MLFGKHARSGLDKPRTLKFHLSAFAAILVLPLFAFALLGLTWIARTELSANEARLQRMATDASAAIDRDMLSWLTVLDTLATSSLIEDRDFASFHARAKAALRNRDAHVILLDREFNQLLNTRLPFGTPLPKTADIDSAEIVLKTGRPYVSDVFTGRVSGQRVVNVAVPVGIGGETRYILIITFAVERISAVIGGEQLPPGWTITVSDRRSQILAQLPPQPAADASIKDTGRGDSGILEPVGASNERWVEAYRWSSVTGWRTSIRVLRSTLDAPFWNNLYGLAALAALAALVTLVTASVFAARIARSMSKLGVAARDLAAGRAIETARQPIAEANTVLDAIRDASNIIADRTHALEASEAQSREQLEQIRLLMGELAHRNKNVMAVLQAIARQISRRSSTLEEFQTNFDTRIAALVRSNDLLFGATGSKGRLAELVHAQLSPFVGPDSPRVDISGPDISLSPTAIQSLGLAFHELATNATKYGALSTPAGKVSVSWTTGDGSILDLVWREEGGPAVAPPTRSGFGSIVIERLTGQNLGGEVDYRFEPGGIVWRLKAPIAAATGEPASNMGGHAALG